MDTCQSVTYSPPQTPCFPSRYCMLPVPNCPCLAHLLTSAIPSPSPLQDPWYIISFSQLSPHHIPISGWSKSSHCLSSWLLDHDKLLHCVPNNATLHRHISTYLRSSNNSPALLHTLSGILVTVTTYATYSVKRYHLTYTFYNVCYFSDYFILQNRTPKSFAISRATHPITQRHSPHNPSPQNVSTNNDNSNKTKLTDTVFAVQRY